jgi:hypothetical protein
MEELSDMVQQLAHELDQMVRKLLFFDEDSDLPAIPWAASDDDLSITTLGHYFAQGRDEWEANYPKTWLQDRILNNSQLQSQWVKDDYTDNIYRDNAVKEYKVKISLFLEKLLVLMHLTGKPLISIYIYTLY